MSKVKNDFLARFKGKISLIDKQGHLGVAQRNASPIVKRTTNRYIYKTIDESTEPSFGPAELEDSKQNRSSVFYRLPAIQHYSRANASSHRTHMPPTVYAPRLIFRRSVKKQVLSSLTTAKNGRSYQTPLPEYLAPSALSLPGQQQYLSELIQAVHELDSSFPSNERTSLRSYKTIDYASRQADRGSPEREIDEKYLPIPKHKNVNHRNLSNQRSKHALQSFRNVKTKRYADLSAIDRFDTSIIAKEPERCLTKGLDPNQKSVPALEKLKYKYKMRPEGKDIRKVNVKFPMLLRKNKL